MVTPAGRSVILSTSGSSPSSVPAPPILPVGERTATFVVNYSGFSAEAEAAFQYAVDIWSGLITSSVPIVIDATWQDLPGNTLGSAGATGLFYNFSGAPMNGVLYPSPLADKLAGTNLSPGEADIVANFDSGTNWYYGLDANPPFSQYDLVSVVMHEIGHGLGFAGTAYVGEDLNGYILNGALAHIYDEFAATGNGDMILDLGNGTAALGDALVSGNLYWAGTQGNAYSGGPVSPKLYAPAIWEPGSSYSHFDEDLYPSGSGASLMTPMIANGEAVHTPGAMCLGVLDDIGWTVDYAALDGGAQGCTDPEACNYDPDATLDDGSCILPLAGEPCGDCISVWSMAANLAAAQGAAFEFGGVGSMDHVEVSVQWTGQSGGGEWVSDLLVVVCDPDGNCVEWGGYDLTAGETDAGVSWPTAWDVTTAGTFTATLDLSGAGLGGVGTWYIALYNGYSDSFGLNLTEVTFTVPYVCPLTGLSPGCADEVACNFDPAADYDDGSCEYLSCVACGGTLLLETFQSYTGGQQLTVQSSAGWETWSGVPGTDEDPYVVFEGSDASVALVSMEVDPAQANDLFFPIGASTGHHMVQFSMEIGAGYTGYYNLQGSTTPGLEWTLETLIDTEGNFLFIHGNDSTLASGFQAGQDQFLTHLVDLDANTLRILLDGQLLALVPYPGNLGGINFYAYSFGAGLGAYLIDDVTVCELTTEAVGCTDGAACNFDPTATVDDGSCWTPFDYGWCDCDGQVFDALGECGGDCAADVDDDGICDDEDTCIGGELDACGVCEGPGAVYECGCTEIPAGDCDCFGNQTDALGICGGDCGADADGDGICDVPGCTDPGACNFDAGANWDDGSCQYAATYYDCAGACLNDADGDGVCDELEVEGCTDADACNFDGDATEEDGSCAYLSTVGIDGSAVVTVGDVGLYVATPSEPGNTYTWAVSGGQLLSGQGSGIVTVEWTTVGSHGLQVVETNAVCNGSVVGLDVEVEAVVSVPGSGSGAAMPLILPNPAREGFSLSLTTGDVVMLDLGGSVVRRWDGAIGGGWFALEGVAPGCYLLRTTWPRGTWTGRLIVVP